MVAVAKLKSRKLRQGNELKLKGFIFSVKLQGQRDDLTVANFEKYVAR